MDHVALLTWAEGRRAELPWRSTRDPWAVLVSELMLQQTQVARVVPRWHRFLDRFPTVGACAAASAGEIVDEWAGLGYNRRAVNLHRAAVAIVECHGGQVPDALDDLVALPGIGAYTARAVLAFAFERNVAVVDTNVGRVLARRIGEPLSPRAAQSLADSLVPDGAGWSWNQVMLDLGAEVCTKRVAHCGDCPVRDGCAWWATGNPDPDPAIGSAAVGRGQSRFEGSFRQGRARLLDRLRDGSVITPDGLVGACGWAERADGPADAERAAQSLVDDGLAVRDSLGALRLP